MRDSPTPRLQKLQGVDEFGVERKDGGESGRLLCRNLLLDVMVAREELAEVVQGLKIDLRQGVTLELSTILLARDKLCYGL